MLTAEQLTARAGLLTASVVADIYATRKDGKESAARRDLRMKLAIERLTGVSLEEPITSRDIERGNELEPAARAAYEMTTGRLVTECAFMRHPVLLAGCSPDGLVGDDGLVELKCPRPATHVETLTAPAVPEGYVPQLVHQLWVTGRAWVDFVSYCPVLPPALQLVIVRRERAQGEMDAHELMVRAFLSEVDATVDRLRGLGER